MPRRNRGGMSDAGMYKHHGKKAVGAIIVGLLVIANAYWGFLSWDYFIGGLLILGGVVKLLMHSMHK